MIDTNVRTYLLTLTAVTDIVGASGVFVGSAQQRTDRPYVVVTQVGGKAEKHAGGVSELSHGTVECRCYGESDAKAGDLADAVEAAIDGKQLAMGSATVRASLVLDKSRDTEPPRQGDQTGYPCVVVTAEVWFQ